MTARQGREMILFRPRFLEPPRIEEENPDPPSYAVEVTTPEREISAWATPVSLAIWRSASSALCV